MNANNNKDELLDNDPVWDLLEQSERPEAGAMFSRNVMREIRLSQHTPTPWWKKLLSPKPALTTLAAAACAVIAVPMFLSEPVTPVVVTPPVSNTPDVVAAPSDSLLEEIASVEDLAPLYQAVLDMPVDEFADHMMIAAANDPSMLDDAEVADLIGF